MKLMSPALRVLSPIYRPWMPVLLVPMYGVLVGVPAAAADDLIVGVGTHLSGGKRPIEKTLDLLSAAGAESLRDDATWAAVEPKKGELRIPPHWDVLVNEARKRNIEPLWILAYGNKFYDGGAKPHSPEGIAAFTRYAEFVVRHFKGRVSRYEIWNEWEHWTGNTTPGSAEGYVRLVRSVYPAIKKVDPQAEVLVGAVGAEGMRKGYLRRLIELGVLDNADGLSLHTYLHCRRWGSGPADWAHWMRDLDRELADLTGIRQTFYVTEMGWPAHEGKCGVSEEEQAEYLTQMFVLARDLSFIKGIWWYDFQNDGPDSTNQEHNFGLVRQDFSKKPAYEALQAISVEKKARR